MDDKKTIRPSDDEELGETGLINTGKATGRKRGRHQKILDPGTLEDGGSDGSAQHLLGKGANAASLKPDEDHQSEGGFTSEKSGKSSLHHGESEEGQSRIFPGHSSEEVEQTVRLASSSDSPKNDEPVVVTTRPTTLGAGDFPSVTATHPNSGYEALLKGDAIHPTNTSSSTHQYGHDQARGSSRHYPLESRQRDLMGTSRSAYPPYRAVSASSDFTDDISNRNRYLQEDDQNYRPHYDPYKTRYLGEDETRRNFRLEGTTTSTTHYQGRHNQAHNSRRRRRCDIPSEPSGRSLPLAENNAGHSPVPATITIISTDSRGPEKSMRFEESAVFPSSKRFKGSIPPPNMLHPVAEASVPGFPNTLLQPRLEHKKGQSALLQQPTGRETTLNYKPTRQHNSLPIIPHRLPSFDFKLGDESSSCTAFFHVMITTMEGHERNPLVTSKMMDELVYTAYPLQRSDLILYAESGEFELLANEVSKLFRKIGKDSHVQLEFIDHYDFMDRKPLALVVGFLDEEASMKSPPKEEIGCVVTVLDGTFKNEKGIVKSIRDDRLLLLMRVDDNHNVTRWIHRQLVEVMDEARLLDELVNNSSRMLRRKCKLQRELDILLLDSTPIDDCQKPK